MWKYAVYIFLSSRIKQQCKVIIGIIILSYALAYLSFKDISETTLFLLGVEPRPYSDVKGKEKRNGCCSGLVFIAVHRRADVNSQTCCVSMLERWQRHSGTQSNPYQQLSSLSLSPGIPLCINECPIAGIRVSCCNGLCIHLHSWRVFKHIFMCFGHRARVTGSSPSFANI